MQKDYSMQDQEINSISVLTLESSTNIFLNFVTKYAFAC